MKYLVAGSEGHGFASPEEAVQTLESIVLPSFDALITLETEGKILCHDTGPYGGLSGISSYFEPISG